MVRRRVKRVSSRKSPLLRLRGPSPANSKGRTKWLETMVANANAATITIDVADEKPPRKARIASPSYP